MHKHFDQNRRKGGDRESQQIMQLSVLNNVSQIGHDYIIILGAKSLKKKKKQNMNLT